MKQKEVRHPKKQTPIDVDSPVAVEEWQSKQNIQKEREKKTNK